MIEQALVSLLDADTQLTALVNKRLFPLRVPQGQPYPAITYQFISRTPTRTLYTASGMDIIRVQVNAFAASYTELNTITGHIRRVLDNYKGIVAGADIARLAYENERDLYDEGALMYHRATDYLIQLRK